MQICKSLKNVEILFIHYDRREKKKIFLRINFSCKIWNIFRGLEYRSNGQWLWLERSIPTPEIYGSNPDMIFLLSTVLKAVLKRWK